MPDVVLPVLNEAQALPWVLARMPAGYRAIVVDNGSDDGSAAIAAGLGATVIAEPLRGFGAACNAGLEACEAEEVCFMDCDRSLDPAELPRVVGPLLDGDADLVLGSRIAAAGSSPLHVRLGNRAITRSVRRRTGVRLSDLGPMRGARTAALRDLGIEDRRFGYPLEMVMRAARAGWMITEVSVNYRPRVGKSKVTGTVAGTVKTVRDMRRVLA